MWCHSASRNSQKDKLDEEKEAISNIPNDEDASMTSIKLTSGQYELVSVVTHQGMKIWYQQTNIVIELAFAVLVGRSADSGHYVAWTKSSKNDGKPTKVPNFVFRSRNAFCCFAIRSLVQIWW